MLDKDGGGKRQNEQGWIEGRWYGVLRFGDGDGVEAWVAPSQ